VQSDNYYADIINSYGPTECTDVVSSYTIDNNEWSNLRTVPIGKPIYNTRLYILNKNLQLVAQGFEGEIYIAGDCVGRGYINQPQLTSEKFIANPFSDGEFMYKTGDLGKWLTDGYVEFIGRTDDQVKIRGYRIELGEIEAAILKYVGVEGAVVVAKSNHENEKELVAYIVGNDGLENSMVRAHLSNNLPAFMIPNHIVILDKFPLSHNGKIDRKKLPAPSTLLSDNRDKLLPRTESEERLVKIWEETLNRIDIGVRDQFFDLGGDSLKAVRIIYKIKNEFKVDIKIEDIFSNVNNIETIAQLIDRKLWIIDGPALENSENVNVVL